MEQSSIGSRIKKRRSELGLTQAQVRQATGISTGNLSDIENGIKRPSAPTLIALSDVLNCSIDWILKGEVLRNENIILSNERVKELIDLFMELSVDDQEELMLIAQIKAHKGKFSIETPNTKR